MENLSYNIVETNNEKNTNLNELINNFDNNFEDLDMGFTLQDSEINNDNIFAEELDYSTNYTVKSLKQILDYYKISYRKMIKSELIQTIMLFENDINNQAIVDKRKKYWNYLKLLKQDDFFSKYIIFEL